ncbi:MAG: DegT/DnrJ/EryC1/StrS family aminotransferase, partial [Candidatus Electrothrix sp. AUS1_2]|nr:DegT/DnrJ/EryC1/StrS family aminotransferase [Candidatus Electrothrix sp. AUS1_2]
AKLDSMIASQQENKAILKEAASKIAGVSFREILDEKGDSATFLAFMLPDKEQAAKVNQGLRENKAGAINFGENTWHFYPSWEHLLGGKTLARNGWPFDAHGKRRFIYDPEALPASVELMNRTLVYQVPVNLSDAQRDTILTALGKAAAL